MAWLLAEFSDVHGHGRRAARRELRFESVLRGPRLASKVVVLNLSEDGMMLHARDDLAVDDVFEVALAGHTARAQVVWKRGTLHGCRFLTRVTRGMIAAVLLGAAPGPRADPAPMTTKP